MALVIATAWGIRGDVTPFLAIGAELKSRGHEVVLVSNPVYEKDAQQAGLSLVPIGTEEDYHKFVGEPGLWSSDVNVHGRAGLKYILPVVEGMYRAVERLHRPGETVLLASRHGAWIAAERFQIPAIGLRLNSGGLSRVDPMHPPRAFPAWIDPVVRSPRGLQLYYLLKGLRNKRRARAGKPTLPAWATELLTEIHRVRVLAGLGEFPASKEAAQPALVLCLWAPWFSPPQKDWPAGHKISGFPFYPKPSGTFARTDTPETSRPVVFMRGSAASHQRAFFAEAVECCRILGRPGVLLTPHAADIPPDLPAGIRHVTFAPLTELFSDAGALVHHGGIGTTAYALAAGIPQLVIPMIGDQFDLAYRTERLGVGTMSTENPVRGASLARELRRLFGSENVRRRCEELQKQIDPDAGCTYAADLVEEVIATRLTREVVQI
jgi:rhamnosyltransferase subunit B